MRFSFVPKKLIEAKREIVKKHSFKVRIVEDFKPNEDLKKLIYKIVNFDLQQLKRESYSLSDSEVVIIASYIPANFYKVDLSNLFFILKLRASFDVYRVFFNAWQDYYDNNECNLFFIDLLNSDNNFVKFLIKNNLTREKFIKFLKSDSIPLEFYTEIEEHKFSDDISVASMLLHYGIRNNSKLFFDFEKLFYMRCHKKYYLRDCTKLVDIIKKYSLDDLYNFLNNFLKQFAIDELCKNFSNLLDILESNRRKRGIKYKFLFEDKYNNWINIDTIYKFFINDINDERFMFWKDYKFLTKPLKYDKSGSLLMEFKNHVVVEFLGRGNGPLYIFNKYFFEKNIKIYLPNKNNSELRKILYRIFTSDLNANNMLREEHQANWRFKVQGIINKHDIAELVKE